MNIFRCLFKITKHTRSRSMLLLLCYTASNFFFLLKHEKNYNKVKHNDRNEVINLKLLTREHRVAENPRFWLGFSLHHLCNRATRNTFYQCKKKELTFYYSLNRCTVCGLFKAWVIFTACSLKSNVHESVIYLLMH